MKFDWLAFLKSRRIQFVTDGHSKGNIGVACPYCGSADRGFHLGISLQGKGWHCWRNKSHAGVRPHRLIQVLLRCSYFEAQRIVGDGPAFNLLDDSSFRKHVASVFSSEVNQIEEPIALKFPKELRKLGDDNGVSRFFLDYLCDRGYKRKQALELCEFYGLRYAISGDYSYRVILPIWMQEGLVTWTGRSIQKNVEPRYRTLSNNKEKAGNGPLAIRSIKNCLWNYQGLIEEPKKALVLVEGPFDALRLDYFGYDIGLRASCLFGKNLTDEQLILLEDISPMYEERYLLLDPDASLDTFSLLNQLGIYGFKGKYIPRGFEDAATLPAKQIDLLFSA